MKVQVKSENAFIIIFGDHIQWRKENSLEDSFHFDLWIIASLCFIVVSCKSYRTCRKMPKFA